MGRAVAVLLGGILLGFSVAGTAEAQKVDVHSAPGKIKEGRTFPANVWFSISDAGNGKSILTQPLLPYITLHHLLAPEGQCSINNPFLTYSNGYPGTVSFGVWVGNTGTQNCSPYFRKGAHVWRVRVDHPDYKGEGFISLEVE